MVKNKKQKRNTKREAAENRKIILLLENQSKDAAKTFPFYEEYHEDRYIRFHEKRKIISLKDKGASVYTLTNDTEKEIVCYEIDGKLITGTGVDKCDFGLYTEDDLLILIELKGSDYSHALDQLQSTIEILVKTNQVSVSRICGRVVLNKTRVPDTLETKEKKLKHLLRKQYNGTLEKCSIKMEETLSNV